MRNARVERREGRVAAVPGSLLGRVVQFFVAEDQLGHLAVFLEIGGQPFLLGRVDPVSTYQPVVAGFG